MEDPRKIVNKEFIHAINMNVLIDTNIVSLLNITFIAVYCYATSFAMSELPWKNLTEKVVEFREMEMYDR